MSSYGPKYGEVIVHNAAASVTSSASRSTRYPSHRSSSSSYYTMDSSRSSSEDCREPVNLGPDPGKARGSSKPKRRETTVHNYRMSGYDPHAPSPTYGNAHIPKRTEKPSRK